ncbi:MAG: SdpI family protein [Oscillospiraceae bacterium]|nr:SdpI family protein [Oscillospiraceae bacterium]
MKNKKTLLLTSFLTLLPIPIGLLLWNRFPETMAVHWGFTGNVDGYASPGFAVFGLPLLMLAFHWLCILFTALDKGNRGRNQKMFRIVLWTIPVISNLSLLGLYAFALDVEFSPVAWTLIPMGILFAVIGNYLPKTRMNSTMGIKVPWTYTSEANWNATHRFAGKVWMAGGLLMMLCALLPHLWAVTVMLVLILVLCLIPMVYSWRYYKKELAEGHALKNPGDMVSKKTRRLSLVFLIVLAVFLAFVLFYGEIDYVYTDDYLLIDTNMYSDNILYYDAIQSLEYREGNVPGLRVGGYGSFRLLMGFFENEEFGTYIRYTYFQPEACVIVHLTNKVLVLSGETQEETQTIYQELLKRTS